MRTRLRFATRVMASVFAAAVHSRMIALDEVYAGAVSRGHIARWAFPYQDLDEFDQPIGTDWFVNVKERVSKALTTGERVAIIAELR